MSLLINDIAEYLEDEGIGTVGEDIFKSMLPANIDDVVAVYETGGLEPDPYLPTKSPTFQVFIRSSNYTTGMAQAMAVRTALHRKANITLVAGGNYYYYILLMSEPAHLGKMRMDGMSSALTLGVKSDEFNKRETNARA